METPQTARSISSTSSGSDDSPSPLLQPLNESVDVDTEDSSTHHDGNLSLSLSSGDKALSAQDFKKIALAVKAVEEHESVVKEKETKLNELRDQLAHCREHLCHLLDAHSSLEEQRRGLGGVATMGLLQSKLKHLLQELSVEQASEEAIATAVQEAELELARAELGLARVREEGDPLGLEKGRSLLSRTKRDQAMARLSTRNKMAANVRKLKVMKERAYRSMLRDKDVQAKAAMRKARQAQQDGLDFLNLSAARRKEEAAVEGERQRSHREGRVRALLEFKGSLEASRGAMGARHLLREERERRRKEAEEEERRGILARGGNPVETALRERRVREFEEGKETLKRRVEEGKLRIVEKLLEEERQGKRKQQQGRTPNAARHSMIGKWRAHQRHKEERSKNRSERRSGIERRLLEGNSLSKGDILMNEGGAPGRGGGLGGNGDATSSESDDEDIGMPHDREVPNGEEESLAEPEIRGLWDTTAGGHRRVSLKVVEGDDGDGDDTGGHVGIQRNKAQQEMMSRTMDSLRQSIVSKQVAGGKEFKGQAFLAKPDEVVFEDFDVGVVYRKRLQLTNVSYTINHCKLVGVSEGLGDFVSVEFSPPGVMSAGLTCPMEVTFEPKLDADLSGSILMMAQTGPFAIPVRCLSKKCIVTVESAQVDFGKVCVGETVQQWVTVRNRGALPTHFQLKSLKQQPVVAQDTLASTKDGSIRSGGGPLADKSAASIMSTVEFHPPPQPYTLCTSATLTCRSAVELTPPRGHSLELEPDPHMPGLEPMRTEGGSSPLQTCSPDRAEGGGDSVVAMATVPKVSGVSGGGVSGEVDDGSSDSGPDLCIKIGKLTEGDIEGFGSLNLELVFAPSTIGQYGTEFSLTFSHPSVQPVTITAHGEGTDLPIFVEQDVMDFHICMLDRSYQNSLVISNRAITAHSVEVCIPKALHTHVQALPKQAVIAGGSSVGVQLKFHPTPDVFACCSEYMDVASGTLEVPTRVEVKGQTRPVLFTLRAQLTVSDVEFSVPLLDFGGCTLQETVIAPLGIINKSTLPQSFGFVHLPEEVSIQPNDGFGTLLPLESLSLDVLFSPRKPRHYSFQLTCLTDANRRFELPCTGKGVMTSLVLSENCLDFVPTSLGCTSTTRVTLTNQRLSRLSSAAIRGEGPPQGPKMFEFCPPEGCPVTLCPLTGTVEPGKSVSVEVNVCMHLDPREVMEEAQLLFKQAAEAEQNKPDPPVVIVEEPSSPKKSKAQGKASRAPSSKSSTQPPPPPPPAAMGTKADPSQLEKPTEGSDLWWQAYSNLLCSFHDTRLHFSIPCFCSRVVGSTPHDGGPSPSDQPPYRLEDTLYLEVSTPILRPSLVVTSDNGRTAVTFGAVSRGNAVSRRVTIKNISDKFLHIVPSLLDPCGPFEIRNPVRGLAAGSSQTILIQFSPKLDTQYLEPLKFKYGSSHLQVQLSGQGVTCRVEVTPEGQLNMGDVIAGDSASRTIKLTNISELESDYVLRMDGVDVGGQIRGLGNGSGSVGCRNLNGQQVFTCVPSRGRILAGSTQDVVVSFSPDRQSPWYEDVLHVDVNGQETSAISLKGRAWTSNMFLHIPDTPSPKSESLEALPTQTTPPILTLQFDGCHEGESVTKVLQAGCIKSALSKKNSGEVSIEPPSNGVKCFAIEPLKTTVEAGTIKNITITFTPNKNSSDNITTSTTTITLKSESTQQYKVVLIGTILRS